MLNPISFRSIAVMEKLPLEEEPSDAFPRLSVNQTKTILFTRPFLPPKSFIFHRLPESDDSYAISFIDYDEEKNESPQFYVGYIDYNPELQSFDLTEFDKIDSKMTDKVLRGKDLYGIFVYVSSQLKVYIDGNRIEAIHNCCQELEQFQLLDDFIEKA